MANREREWWKRALAGLVLVSSVVVALPLGAAGSGTDEAIAFLEARVAADAGDSVAWNRLGNLYLERLRATGDHDYLDEAARCAEASLRAVPAEGNQGGLVLQIRAKLGAHSFAEGERLARRLIDLDPHGFLGWQLLGDALLELGRYDEAPVAFAKAVELGGVTSASETRLARVAFLHGDRETARRRLESARAIASGQNDRATLAWCEWQLGELAFGGGDFAEAAKRYDAALAITPDSVPALGARGRLEAARGELQRAIATYEQAIALDEFPPFVAALADLYAAQGNQRRADELFERIEENASSPRERRLDRRHLVRIYSDHRIQPLSAYLSALDDYLERPDIYAADALAWAALGAGELDEARHAMKESLRLGTQDATLFFHAGMIALAACDEVAALDWLEKALRLNPKFDFLQAPRAAAALSRLRQTVVRPGAPANDARR